MSFEGILSDIKVLDFSTLLPGPLASLFLSEMGAEVIKVERLKHGDEMRRKTPEIDGTVRFDVRRLYGQDGMIHYGLKAVLVNS